MKGNAQLMPMISVESVDQARTFYVEKLGFGHMMGMLGKDGRLDFCTVTLGGAKVMLQRPQAEDRRRKRDIDKATSGAVHRGGRRERIPRSGSRQWSEDLRTVDGSVVGRPDLHRDRSIRIPHLVLSDGGRSEAAVRR